MECIDVVVYEAFSKCDDSKDFATDYDFIEYDDQEVSGKDDEKSTDKS